MYDKTRTRRANEALKQVLVALTKIKPSFEESKFT